MEDHGNEHVDDEEYSFTVTAAEAGIRLDHLLARLIPAESRSVIATSIRTGCILVDGTTKKAGYKVKEGNSIHGHIQKPDDIDVIPERIDFPVLFEDDHLMVISKPPGLVVHPGSGNSRGTLVNGLVYYCNMIAEVGDPARPGIVHRLDKDTSGLMVIAKSGDVHRKLVEAFKAREVEKHYIALVHGVPDMMQGRIIAPIGRHPVNRQKMAVREFSGRYAASSWEVVAVSSTQWSKIKVRIETGRTHQIRVHMAHIGYPVAGDTLYGSGRKNSLFPRQMLHAWRLRFTHPVRQEVMRFTAPLWEDMETVCDQLELQDIEP